MWRIFAPNAAPNGDLRIFYGRTADLARGMQQPLAAPIATPTATHIAAAPSTFDATITIVSSWSTAYKLPNLRFEHLPRYTDLLLAAIESKKARKDTYYAIENIYVRVVASWPQS